MKRSKATASRDFQLAGRFEPEYGAESGIIGEPEAAAFFRACNKPEPKASES